MTSMERTINPYMMSDPEGMAAKMPESCAVVDLGRDCVAWTHRGVCYAGGRGPSRLAGGQVVVWPDGESRVLLPFMPGAREASKGRKGKGITPARMWCDGIISAEVMMILAMRSGKALDQVAALAMLRQQLAAEDALGDEMLGKAMTIEGFSRIAGDWLVDVIRNDGAAGVATLKLWTDAAERALARRGEWTMDKALVQLCEAIRGAARLTKECPTRAGVRAQWERLAKPEQDPEKTFKRLLKRTGFEWLP